MNRLLCLLIFLLVISPPSYHSDGYAQDNETTHGKIREAKSSAQAPSADGSSIPTEKTQEADPQALLENLVGPLDTKGVDTEAIATTTGWIQASGLTELLGPLTPLALSPFFGVTCLSAISLWGPEWASSSPMLGANGALRSETIFISFLLLTILSSIPRFTKVSKPFAQAVDRLEAYAVIIMLLVIKITAAMEAPGDAPVAMVQMGVLSLSFDTFLAIAMVINILIINSVKFFFEFLAWLTPIPFMDAVFELCNKTLCLGLMAIYAFSPTLATLINLAFFIAALIIFRWIYRRTLFYRTMILDPVLARLWPPHAKPRGVELVVFNRSELAEFPAKSRLRLKRRDDQSAGWVLQESRWWLPQREHLLEPDTSLEIHLGWIMHSVEFTNNDKQECLTFSRRYNTETLQILAGKLGITLTTDVVERDNAERALEFG